MKSKEILRDFDSMNVFKRRFQIITLSRLRDKTKIKKASEAIDKIRARTKNNNTSLTGIIRKWRDTRYGPSNS